MAIIWHDGFDAAAGGTLATYMDRLGYTGTTSGALGTGRTGTGVSISNTIPKYILPSALTTIVVGVAFKVASLASRAIISLYDAVGVQVTLCIDTNGSLILRRGSTSGTILSQSANGLVTTASWSYYELKVTIDNSTGSYEVRRDGVEVFTGSGADTQNQTGSTVTLVELLGGGSGADIDDFYVLDTTGSSPWNDFLGPVQSLAKMPTAEGSDIDWTPSTGTDNSATVDEKPANDDTDYNSAASASLIDLLVHDTVGAGDTIIAVSQRALVKKTDAGVASLQLLCRTNSTNFSGSSQAIPDSYTYLSRLYQVNPDTTGQWTASEVNAAEFGYESA